MKSILTLSLVSAVLLSSCSGTLPGVYFPENPEWRMTVESVTDHDDESVMQSSDCAAPLVRKGFGKVSYIYENCGGKNLDIRIVVRKGSEKGSLELTSIVTNKSEDLLVKAFEGPMVHVPALEDRGYRLLDGVAKFTPLKDLKKRTCIYPSGRCRMQYFALAGREDGFYMSSDDPELTAKRQVAVHNQEEGYVSMGWEYLFTCFPGEERTNPATVFIPYEGDWHAAADIYRKWFDANREKAYIPEWVQHSTGWLLTILKQQNGEILWPYDSLSTALAREAKKRGFDIIGLFGWGEGGHDRHYPDYVPDPEMGGREALVKGIAELKAQGLRTIIYANGQLIDQEGTQFWPDTGRFITVTDKHGVYRTAEFQKFYGFPNRVFGLGCFSCDVWRNRLLNLALQAKELGADGILYDQLAGADPVYCYNEGHGHRVPAVTYAQDRTSMLEDVRRVMNSIDPEFVLLTEGFADCELSALSMFHRGPGGGLDDQMDVFRYTFPDFVATVSNPAPVNSRSVLNLGTMRGVRNEIELRYAPELDYIKYNKIITADDYAGIKLPGSGAGTLKKIAEEDQAAMSVYTKQVMDFQREHSDILWDGRYMDDKFFTISFEKGKARARSFVNGDRLGIVVCNSSANMPAEYTLTPAEGYVLTGVYAPDREVSSGDPLMPKSIHLYEYKKNK